MGTDPATFSPIKWARGSAQTKVRIDPESAPCAESTEIAECVGHEDERKDAIDGHAAEDEGAETQDGPDARVCQLSSRCALLLC